MGNNFKFSFDLGAATEEKSISIYCAGRRAPRHRKGQWYWFKPFDFEEQEGCLLTAASFTRTEIIIESPAFSINKNTLQPSPNYGDIWFLHDEVAIGIARSWLWQKLRADVANSSCPPPQLTAYGVNLIFNAITGNMVFLERLGALQAARGKR